MSHAAHAVLVAMRVDVGDVVEIRLK